MTMMLMTMMRVTMTAMLMMVFVILVLMNGGGNSDDCSTAKTYNKKGVVFDESLIYFLQEESS